jgi:hypothetical protein
MEEVQVINEKEELSSLLHEGQKVSREDGKDLRDLFLREILTALFKASNGLGQTVNTSRLGTGLSPDRLHYLRKNLRNHKEVATPPVLLKGDPTEGETGLLRLVARIEYQAGFASTTTSEDNVIGLTVDATLLAA